MLTAPAINLNIHLPNLLREASHHLIVLLALLLQAVICSVHVTDLIGELRDSVLHVAQLVP